MPSRGDGTPPAASRIALFLGKGGVGKSTLAAATAVAEADGGARTLLVSTDQAHSLSEVLDIGVPVTAERVAHAVVGVGRDGGTLEAMALDTVALAARGWPPLAATLADRLPESDIADLAPEEIGALPGVAELAAWHEVAALADTRRWDAVVVDCASTADALRMLELPAALALYLERAWPRHRRLSAGADRRTAAVAEVCERMAVGAESLAALLADHDRVAAHLVLTPERVVAAETVRTLGQLALAGVRLAQLLVNEVLVRDEGFAWDGLPAHPAFDHYVGRLAAQEAVLTDLAARVGDTEMLCVPHLAAEPVGPRALGRLLDAAYRRGGRPPPPPPRPVVERESGSGLGAVYLLRLELPHVAPGDVTLGRAGDDLVIGVGGVRRRVWLASVLRRCTVIGARWRGDELTVRFRPDPEVWPA